MEAWSNRKPFDQDGYVILRAYMDSAETTTVRSNVERYIQEVISGMPQEQVYYEIPGDVDSLKQIQKMHTYDTFFESLFTTGNWRRISLAAT